MDHAFKNKIDRFTGWTASSKAALQAASIYRRGVAQATTEHEFRSENISGEYKIDFFTQQSKIESILDEVDTFFIIDKNVYDRWPNLFRNQKQRMILEIDEITKTLDTVGDIQFASRKSKKWTAIGGGVLTDTASMAASLTGAKIQFIPTTLLAMSDACVGGKTGVNYPPYGKNQVGRFYFPMNVAIWPGWLNTLDPRELKSGAVEGMKHAILCGDKILFDGIAKSISANNTVNEIGGYLERIVQIKADVVEKDPAENGLRATLNLGHTLAHALEACSHKNSPNNYLRHGEAVSIGLAFAAILSTQQSKLPLEDRDHIISRLTTSGCLPNKEGLKNYLGIPINEGAFFQIFPHTKSDKKSVDGESRWVLLEAFGSCEIGDGRYSISIGDAALQKAWGDLLNMLK